MNLIKKMLVAPAAIWVLWAASVQAASNEEIAERLKPVGEVCVMGQECKGVEAVAATAGGGARSADDVVGKHCAACHNAGVLGAPKTGDSGAWQARVDARGGLDAVLKSAIAGIGAMPPKGTCGDCSDDELMAAIKKMSGL